MKNLRFLLILLLFCGNAFAQTQPVAVVRSTETITQNGIRYYVHHVKKSETVYSICRAYGISNDDFQQANPSIKNNAIEVDQALLIIAKPTIDSNFKGSPFSTKPSDNTNVSASVTNTNNNAAQNIKHTVMAKETLSSISRLYNISVDDILIANPGIDKSSIAIGTELQIPINKISSSDKSTKATFTQNGITFLAHPVQRKETLYSISNLYEVHIEQIKQYNPQAFSNESNQVQTGQVLLIPISLSGMKCNAATSQTAAIQTPCDTNAQRYTLPINIAMLLPLNTSKIDDDNEMARSFKFMEMYEGAMLALEILRKQGASVTLSILDSKSTNVSTLAQSAALEKADLIIGPVYQDIFKPIAEVARQRNIKIVSPLTLVDTALRHYPNIFQIPVDPNKQMQLNLQQDELNPATNNILVISQRDNANSLNLYKAYRQYLTNCDTLFYRNAADIKVPLQRNFGFDHKTIRNLAYRVGLQPRENQNLFLKIFNPDVENKVIVTSQEEPFVSELLTNLKTFSDRYKYNVTVYGLTSWQKFENTELNLFYDLKLHLTTPYYIDYKSEEVKQFVQSFRDTYKTEPSQFAFQGYDVMLYFASAIHRYGKNFEGCLSNHNVHLLQSNYSFTPAYPNGAMENTGMFKLRYTPWMEVIQYK